MRRLNRQTVKSNMIALLAGVALFISLLSGSEASAASAARAESWTELARKVGASEDVRFGAIKELRKIKNLNSKLRAAIYTSERPLALDVISALDIKELIPDLLLHVPADPDGFLTVAINAMMNEKNQAGILKSYLENLEVANLSKVSPAAVVAMLEPVGRLGLKLSRENLIALKSQTSPEVRSSLLYYLRIMSLRHRSNENLDLVTELLRSKEFQLRLQSVSVSSEILATNKETKGLLSSSDLKNQCREEKASQVRAACLNFLEVGEKR